MHAMETSKWKYVPDQKWTTKDWGRYALIGMLVGSLLSVINPVPMFQIFIDLMITAGIVCGIVWYRKRFFSDHA